MADYPSIGLTGERSTGLRSRIASRIIRHLPSDREWREPFTSIGTVFGKVPADRPRYGSDLDPKPIALLTALRDRPSIVIGDIQRGWRPIPDGMTRSPDWEIWRRDWFQSLQRLDPAARYWLRWRVGLGGKYIHPSVYRRVINAASRGNLITRLWDLSDRLQGAQLEGGVDWQTVLDRPGDAVFYLDPPGPIRFADAGYDLPITPKRYCRVNWRAIVSRLRREDRPWILTAINTPEHRDRFLFAFQQVVNAGTFTYLLVSNQPFK